MARVELRKPIEGLMEEKTKIERQLTNINDHYTKYHTQLSQLRADQFSYREGKETLSNTVQNKPARRVFDQKIADCQLEIDKTMKLLEDVEKERVVWSTKLKAMDKSLNELRNA